MPIATAGLFAAYRTLVLGAGLNLSSATINAIFIDDTDDTPVLATDDFMDDLAGTPVPVEASAPALASKTLGTVGAGVFDAADTVFTSLSGDQVENLVIYEDSGAAATSDLIAGWGTGVTGLPLTPNGGNVTVVWSASGIFTF